MLIIYINKSLRRMKENGAIYLLNYDKPLKYIYGIYDIPNIIRKVNALSSSTMRS